MIDLSVLHNYSGGDKEFELEIIQTFIDESNKYAELLNINNSQGNVKEIAKAAHKLKSAVSVFGIKELHELLDKLEKSCNQIAVSDSISDLTKEVLNSIELVIVEMKKLKKKMQSELS